MLKSNMYVENAILRQRSAIALHILWQLLFVHKMWVSKSFQSIKEHSLAQSVQTLSPIEGEGIHHKHEQNN